MNTILEESPGSNMSLRQKRNRNREIKYCDIISESRQSDLSEEDADDEDDGESEQEESNYADTSEEKKDSKKIQNIGKLSQQLAQSFANSAKKQSEDPQGRKIVVLSASKNSEALE